MLIYFVLIAIIILLYFTINKTKLSDSIKRNTFVWISAVLFLLLFSLRHEYMGYDLNVYLSSFKNINKMSWGEVLSNPKYIHFEPGFVVLNKFIGSIWLNNNFYLFFIAFLSILPVFVVIQKHSSNVLISVLIWVCCGHFLYVFSALRQAIAMAICLYAMSKLWDNHPLQFLIWVLVAWLIHSSSIIILGVLIPYVINNSRGLKSFYTIMIIVAFVAVFLFPQQMATIAMTLIGKTYNPSAANDGTGLMALVYFAVYIFALLTHNQNDSKSELVINIYAIAVVAQAFSRAHSQAGRIAVFFEIVVIILLPVILCECYFGEKNPKPMLKGYINVDNYRYVRKNTPRYIYIDGAMWCKILVIICFLVLGLYQIAYVPWPRANPYIFFWMQV